MESGGSASQFIAFFLGLAITAGILVPILLRLRSTVGEARFAKSALFDQFFSFLKKIEVKQQAFAYLSLTA